MDINDWTQLFLKHQDLLRREIKEIVEKEGVLLVTKKECEEEWYACDKLVDALGGLDPAKRQGIVCLNTQENLDALLARWKEIKDHPTLKIVFANPKLNDRWILVPHHHAKVADEKTLKIGFEAMFNGVARV